MARGPGRQPGDGKEVGLGPATSQRLCQGLDVPPPPVSEDPDLHRRSSAARRSTKTMGGLLEERGPKQRCIEAPGSEGPAAGRAGDSDLRRAKEERIDLIEVAVIALEQVAE